jgi:hypothetical protein
MGYKALLSDNSTVQPAVDVLAGRLTPKQANSTFKGTIGTCPHCQALRAEHAFTDNQLLQAALREADLTVFYKSAHLVDEVMKRLMHFAHRPGFLKTDAACLLCRDADLAHHAAALEVIADWAAKQWPNCSIESELTVVLPGTPPEKFSPDISIRSREGAPVSCIEYQRSHESYDHFIRRHEIRHRQFDQVLWFFDRGVYTRARAHRRYLDERSEPFFKCWTDPQSGQLQAEHGVAPERVWLPPTAGTPEKCSLASLINAFEGRDEPRRKKSADDVAINRALPLEVINARRAAAARLQPPAPQVKTVEEHVRLALAAGYKHPSDIQWQLERAGAGASIRRIKEVVEALLPAAQSEGPHQLRLI